MLQIKLLEVSPSSRRRIYEVSHTAGAVQRAIEVPQCLRKMKYVFMDSFTSRKWGAQNVVDVSRMLFKSWNGVGEAISEFVFENRLFRVSRD